VLQLEKKKNSWATETSTSNIVLALLVPICSYKLAWYHLLLLCSGQRCTAVKVILIMESVADTLVEKVKAKVAKLTVGPPEDDCDITPVVTESSANFIEGLVMDAKQKGATFCQEYKREGNLIWPLLLDNVRPDMRIAWEEPFGPVLPVIRINSIEEAIHHSNASNFGLQV